jgi:hypothetical protein
VIARDVGVQIAPQALDAIALGTVGRDLETAAVVGVFGLTLEALQPSPQRSAEADGYPGGHG